MSRFQPLVHGHEIPDVGAGWEGLHVDFKAHLDAYRRAGKLDLREIAKDIAALANAYGGSILIGVDEDRPSGRVKAIKGVTPAEAVEARKAVDDARDRHCHPAPLASVDVVEKGAVLVAVVNVWPSPGVVIGVDVEGVQDAYKLPVRLGEKTDYLKLEQLPMLMSPDVRRVALVLSTFRGDTSTHVLPADGSIATRIDGANIIRLDELENSVIMRIGTPVKRGNQTFSKWRHVSFPLNMVRAAWKAGSFQFVAIEANVLAAVLASPLDLPESTFAKP